jgi:hypothetical protein
MATLGSRSSFENLAQGSASRDGILRLLSSASTSVLEKNGVLEASILSVYDLPFSEPPVAVTLTTCGMTASSGPPVARHKDCNSFRFTSAPTTSDSNNTNATASNNGKNEVKLVAPLRDLYKSQVTIRVLYTNKSQLLETEYEIRQLRIHESKWLILNLTKSKSGDAQAMTTNNLDNDDEEIAPTIRLKLELSGPYRPEVAALVGLCQAWFGLVDHVEENVLQVWSTLPKLPMEYSKYILLPTVPVLAVLVVVSPVVAGIVMVALPFLLPFVLIIISVAAGLLVTGGVVYSSTKHGREHIGGTLAPLVDSLLSSRAEQSLVYDTGPRPTPVSVAKQVLPKEMWARLVVSLLIDLIGSSSYLLPVVGEAFDLAWAPIQTIMVMAMYDLTTPNLKYVSFAEEILPFTDIVPTATIGWGFEFVPKFLDKNPDVAKMVNVLVPERTGTTAADSVPNPYR